MIRRLTASLAAVCALAAIAPAAQAATAAPTADCQAHGHLTQAYSITQLRTSLAQMPADVQEYTNCYSVIQSALLSQIPGRHGKPSNSSSHSSSGSFLSTPVIIVIVVLALGGATAGAVAIRRRAGSD
jgi:hypothetical protein